MARVVGAEQIEAARARGLKALEVLPGDILTDMARETASRLGVALLDGPLPKPAAHRTDGATAQRRALYRRSSRWSAPARGVRPDVRRFKKIAFIGAGGVGANVAHLAAMADAAERLALIDVAPGVAAATALDLNHAAGVTRARARAEGGERLDLVTGADLVVVSAGRPRTPGMSRADLIEVNRRVIHTAAEAIKSQAPDAVVIVVTNPLDEMTYEMLRATGFPRARVLGMAGTLDSSRFRNALADAAGVDPGDVDAIALGAHGAEMVPVPSLARIKGRAIDVFLSGEAIEGCVKAAIGGGGAVVALKKTGSATIAPAHATMELIDHLRGARAGWAPASVLLEGEYGLEDVVLGVPCHLGHGGLAAVEELPLTATEAASLQAAGAAIRARLAS